MKNLEITTGLFGAMPPSETLGSLVKSIELQKQGVEVFMLSVGEPDFDTPQFIKEACAEAMMRGETKYTVPAGIGELREACAAKFLADGVKTAPSRIIVTPGGKFACGAAIAAALSGTFADPVAAYAFLVFVLLYVPCVAAVSTIRAQGRFL